MNCTSCKTKSLCFIRSLRSFYNKAFIHLINRKNLSLNDFCTKSFCLLLHGHNKSSTINSWKNSRVVFQICNLQNLAAGTSYSMGIKPWEMTVTTSFSHQQSDGYNTRYTSDILSVSTGRSFLKEKNLNVSGTLSACYNNVKDQMRNLSMGFDMQCGYTMKKVHVFSMSAGFNKYSDTNISEDKSSRGTTELSVSLGYNYTFSLLEIKKKSRPTPDPSL